MRSGLATIAEALHELGSRQTGQARGLWRMAVTTPANVLESNIRYLCIETAPAAVLGAAASFNAAFAIRLGASNEDIGLLSSIPALLAVLVLIPSGQIIGQRAQRMPLVTWSLFITRLTYLLLAFVPLLSGLPQGAIVVALLIAVTPPNQFFGLGWNSMLADVVPEARRARVFAVRNIVSAVAVTGSIYVFGLWLDRVRFPINYQVMYVVGFTAALLSSYWITKLRVPDSFVPPPRPRQPIRVRTLLRQTRQTISTHHDFVRMTVNTLLHGTGLWMIGPLYILYYVRQLGATDGWIGLNGMLGNLTPIFGYWLWQRGVRKWGENSILKRMIVLNGLYPILVGLTPHLGVIPLLTAVQGFLIGPAVNLTHLPMLLKVCPDERRPQYIAVFSTIMNISAFIMPLIGVALAGVFGFGPVIVAGGVMSVLGSSSFIWNRLRTPDSLAVRQQEAETGCGFLVDTATMTRLGGQYVFTHRWTAC
jgi:hypothetical protein